MSEQDPKDLREENDLPLMTNEDQEAQTNAEDEIDDAGNDGDEYDIRDELDDNDRHVLDLLTDEERAALDDVEGDDDTEGATDDEQGDDAPPIAEEIEPATESEAKPQAPVSADLTDEDRARIREATQAKQDAALEAWRDGDMTDEELREAMGAALEAAEQERAAILAEKQLAAEEVEFERRQAEFTEVAKGYLTAEYPALASADHLPRFNQLVGGVSVDPRMQGKTPRQILEAAHKLYQVEADIHGFEIPKLKASGAKEPATPDAKPARKPQREVVPTLARIPAAAANSVADGKWSALQAKFDAVAHDPSAQERLLRTLSPEEMEAWASMDV